jgi:hypothetical protein
MSKKATYLKNLRLSELSLVDEPACEGARVSIFKRADAAAGGTSPEAVSKETSMTEKTPEHIALEANVADLTKRLGDTEAALAKANADLAAVQADVAKAADETIEAYGVTISKSKNLELFTVIKAQQSELAAAREAAQVVDLTKRAETELGNLPGEPIAKAAVLKAVATLPEDVRTTLDALLKAGNAAMAQGMKEIGKGGATTGSSADRIEQLAIAKAGAGASKTAIAKAYDDVLQSEEGRALYAASLRGE